MNNYKFIPWDGSAPPKSKPIPVCSYEGPTITLCSRGDDWHTRRCDHPQADWDTCRRDGIPGQNEQRCSVCPLHSRHEIGRVRHLLYFICPRAGNGIWRWNVEQLLRRIDLFNGKRVIAIATGNGPCRPGVLRRPMDSPEEVKAMFPPGCEFLEFPNNRNLGEAVAWESLWSRVPDTPGDVTFYGHAKGIKWGNNHPNSRWIRLWCELMYETCLDDWPSVAEQLKAYPLTGSIRKLGYCFPEAMPASRWHFSGSFFWARNADWLARGGGKHHESNMTSEALPGVLFKPEEAGHLVYTGLAPGLHLYEEMAWRTAIFPAWRKWREARGLDAAAVAG